METEKPKPRPKTPPTKRKSRAAKLSKEQLLIALQKKKECNARAQKIVETLLDPVPPEKVEYFLSRLIHLNQAHYDDIVEERSIVKLCGYPVCDTTLANIPKQQYSIASSRNKVYDITERKKFCSNKCYKSSVYLKEQILTTPLWVRRDDDIIPEFKLLTFDDNEKEAEKQPEKVVENKQEKIVEKPKEKLVENQSRDNDVDKQVEENDEKIGKEKEKDKAVDEGTETNLSESSITSK
ncbi:putative RNA polymerase II subunit B1 CTD phosphatase RPAP2 homolog [Sitodiplosis mosellana]|uniref:putative RNA polymerase II subunit B1 CTD phosphatase RPAP2 homolog n=1 Tax=Sitodiplosis mosellana TaxID=263140 RepID=UPI00244403FB|nr:putative RNA polymerase II subunit B1 CTD phosphatase RPAP2 homolog [Sitodiplosis mosellana]